MANDNGQIWYSVGIDDTKLRQDANRVIQQFKNIGSQVEAQGARVDTMFNRVTAGVAGIFTLQQAKQFATEIVRVRGEFQQLDVAFKTMLGSKSKADALMAQIVDTAAKTPFDLQGVANGAKQLLAYGTASEDVNGTLVRLGNVCAGLNIPLNDMVYLYGTTMTQGRLFTHDLRQFMGRGIPLADELAKQFGVTKEQVGELVTAGRVGFPEVQKAIEAMTNEGGRFYNLMEEQSKTIAGRVSNLGDAWTTMLNNVGQESEGAINSALSGASYLIEHYEEVGRILGGLIATYGVYKASVMAVAAVKTAQNNFQFEAEALALQELLPAKATARNADIEAAVTKGQLSQARADQVIAIRAEVDAELEKLRQTVLNSDAELNAAKTTLQTAKEKERLAEENIAIKQTELQNAITAAQYEKAMALDKKIAIESEKQSRLSLRVVKLQERQDEATARAYDLQMIGATQEKIAAKNREIAAIGAKVQAAQVEEMQSSRNIAALRQEQAAIDATISSKEVERAQGALSRAENDLATASQSRLNATKDMYAKKAAVNVAVTKMETLETKADNVATVAGAKAKDLMSLATGRLKLAMHGLGVAIKANPIGFILSAITTAISLITTFVAAKKAEKQAIEDAIQPMRDEYVQTNLLIAKLSDANLKEEDRKKILEELKQVNPDIVKGVTDEATAYEELSKKLEGYNKQKLAEMAIKRFSLDEGFDGAVKELSTAQDELQKAEEKAANMVAGIAGRIADVEAENKKIPDGLRKTMGEMKDILNSSAPVAEKLQTLFDVGQSALKDSRSRGGSWGPAWEGNRDGTLEGLIRIMGEIDPSDYENAFDKATKAAEKYKTEAAELKAHANAMATAMALDPAQRESFIGTVMAQYLPDELKKTEAAVNGATNAARTWKDELKDLVGEDYKVDIDAATNIGDVISLIQKKLKEEQDNLDAMKPLLIKAGFDFDSMSFPAPLIPDAYQLQLQDSYTKSFNKAGTLKTVQTTLGVKPSGGKSSSGDAFAEKIKTEMELIKSAKAEYAQLLKVMSSGEAFKAIQDSATYSKVQLKDIIASDKDNEGYVNYLSGLVDQLSKRKTTEAKALVAKINQELDSIQFDAVKTAREQEQTLTDEQNELEKSRIKDKIQLIEYERDQRIAAIEAERKAYVNLFGKGADTTIFDLRINIAEAKADDDIVEEKKQQLADLKQQWQGWADDYQQIEDKLTKLGEDAAKDRKDIQDRYKAGDIGLLEASQATSTVDNGEAAQKSKLEAEKIKISKNWVQLFGDLDGMSRKEIQTLIANINEQLAHTELAPVDAAALLEQLDKAKEYTIAKNPFANWADGLEETRVAVKKVQEAQEALNKAIGTSGEETARKKLKAAKSEERIARAKTAKSASEGLKEAADMSGAVSDLLKTFGVESPAVDGVVSALGSLASIDFTNPFSIITGGLKAVASLFQGIFGESDKKKEKKIQQLQDDVDRLGKSYDSLGKDIDKAYSTDASDKLDLQNKNLSRQNELIRQQIETEKSKKNADDGKIKQWEEQIEKNTELIAENREKAMDAIFGQDIASAIDEFAQAYADAWAAGEDRAGAMKDVVKKMIRGVVMEMLKMDLQPTVEKIREAIKTAMVDNIITDSEQAAIDKMVEDATADADRKYSGLDKFMKDDKEETREASAKGIATASQDSVDENNGRLTTIQGHTFTLNENLALLVSFVSTILERMGFSVSSDPLPESPALGAVSIPKSGSNPIADLQQALQAQVGANAILPGPANSLQAIFNQFSRTSESLPQGSVNPQESPISAITEGMRMLTTNSANMLKHLAGIESNTAYCRKLETLDTNVQSLKTSVETINLKGITLKR